MRTLRGIFFGILILTGAALAQQESAFAVAAACGPATPDFAVKNDQFPRTVTPAEPGKAQVYFIQDIGQVSCLGSCVTTKIGMDGRWEGAAKGNSYFYISVDPGEHHLCARWQSRVTSASTALLHFTADAGRVYYFRTRTFWGHAGGSFGEKDQTLIDLEPVDSDQGRYLIASDPLSVSHPQK
jgi:hypothetical protein